MRGRGVVAPTFPEKYSFRKNGFECDQGCNADDSGTGPSEFRLQNTATKTTSCLRVVGQEVTLTGVWIFTVTKNNTGQWRRRRQLLKDRDETLHSVGDCVLERDAIDEQRKSHRTELHRVRPFALHI